MSHALHEPAIATAIQTTIACSSRKGGAGKTSVASSSAAALAAAGYSVLAVDLDPQGNLTESLTGIKQHELTVVDLLTNPQLDIAIPSAVEGVQIMASGLGLLDEAADLVAATPEGHRRFAAVLRDAIRRNGSTFVIIDTQPTFSSLLMVALDTADFVISPVDIKSRWSANGAGDVKGYVEQALARGAGRAQFAGAVLNKVPALARKVATAVAEDLEAAGIDVSDAMIPDLKAAVEGEYLGRPGYLAGNAKYSAAFDRLAEDLITLHEINKTRQGA